MYTYIDSHCCTTETNNQAIILQFEIFLKICIICQKNLKMKPTNDDTFYGVERVSVSEKNPKTDK